MNFHHALSRFVFLYLLLTPQLFDNEASSVKLVCVSRVALLILVITRYMLNSCTYTVKL